MERPRFYQQQNNPEEKKPIDIKAAEWGKVIDKGQMAVGGTAVVAGLIFPPAAVFIGPGLVIGGLGVVEHYGKNRYIKWRMKGRKPHVVQSESKVVPFRKRQVLPQAA